MIRTLVTVVAGLSLGATPAFAQTQRAPIPIVVPKAPPITNQASSALFDAMLAISRAQQANPQAAQTASFEYAHALQQYRSGNIDGARRSALQSVRTASQPGVTLGPQAAPSVPLGPAATQLPGLQGGLYGADAPAIDADSFLALARGILAECAARHDPALAAAQKSYVLATRDFAAQNWQRTRSDAKAAISTCAKAQN